MYYHLNLIRVYTSFEMEDFASYKALWKTRDFLTWKTIWIKVNLTNGVWKAKERDGRGIYWSCRKIHIFKKNHVKDFI